MNVPWLECGFSDFVAHVIVLWQIAFTVCFCEFWLSSKFDMFRLRAGETQ